MYTGVKGGMINKRKLPMHSDGVVYTVQKKASFDAGVMLDLVERILKPYVAMAFIGIVPILFLDSFKVHLLGSIANAINNLGIKIKYVPGGCTGLVQPIAWASIIPTK